MTNDETKKAAVSLLALAEVTPEKRISRKDKEMNARLRVDELACRLGDLHDEMAATLKTLKDNTRTKREKQASLRTIKKLYLPFLSMSSNLIATDVKVLAPIGNSPYVHASNERKRNITAQKSMNSGNSCKSTKLQKSRWLFHHTFPSHVHLNPRRKKYICGDSLPG